MKYSNKAKLIQEKSKALPAENHAQRLIKAFYSQKAEDLLENSSNTNKTHCPKCKTLWSDDYFTETTKPAVQKGQVRRQKQILKLKRLKTRTKKEERLLMKLQERSNPVSTKTCKLCGYETKIIHIQQPQRPQVFVKTEKKPQKPLSSTYSQPSHAKNAKNAKKKKPKGKFVAPSTIQKAKTKDAANSLAKPSNLMKLAAMLKQQSQTKSESGDRLKRFLE